jgi:GNAT superfamily N-acetyltransferase
MPTLRPATPADISGMHRVRLAVRENRLTSTAITEVDYVPAITTTGRGWVIESDSVIVAFAVGNRESGNIWALFVHPDHEALGYGLQLHDAMLSWLWSQGLERLWLTTEPGTRAEAFYASRGWERVGNNEHGEIRFELSPAPT